MSLDLLTLPVWSIRPNWAGGITERLEWLTDVLVSRSGSEQRRAARLSPRRSFEMTVNPLDNQRSFTDLFLHRLASEEMLFPLWHDSAKLDAEVTSGDVAIPFDNTYREHAVDQCAILYQDAFTWEVIYIDAMDDNGLTAATPVTYTWPAGTKVFPMRAARLTAESNFSALTSRVGEAQLLFTMTRENDFTEAAAFDLTLGGRPVMVKEPNRSESLDQAYQRLVTELDNPSGRKKVVDVPGRSFVTQLHNWMCVGRQEHFEMREFLYYLRGRARSVWIPTFNDDLKLARSSAAGSSLLDIDKIGYAYTGGSVAGRNVVWFKRTSGYEIAVISTTGAALAADEERLVLATPLANAYAPGQLASFMDVARLDQDTIEIQHHTDSDGVCEISGAFRTFRDARDPSGTIDDPIPAAVMTATPCG